MRICCSRRAGSTARRTMISGAREHENIEQLAVEHPADQRDQRNAQEIERHHHGRVAGAEGLGQAVVRGQADDADAERRAEMLTELEMDRTAVQRSLADQRHRQLHQVHPEDDGEGALGHGQLLGDDQRDRVAERRATAPGGGRLEAREPGPHDHQHADEPEHDDARAGSGSCARARTSARAAPPRPAW